METNGILGLVKAKFLPNSRAVKIGKPLRGLSIRLVNRRADLFRHPALWLFAEWPGRCE